MLRIEDISFSYGAHQPVLDHFSLGVNESEIVSLLGPSGCGKSTVLRIIAGLISADKGAVHWSCEPNVAFVFQDPALMPWATVRDNVALPGRLNGAVDHVVVSEVIKAVGLGGMEERYPLEISGGQRMRVSVARALSAQPKTLLMDEPFAALDEILRFQMNDLLLQLSRERGFNILFVTHSLFEASYVSDRVLVMNHGKIVGEVRPALDRGLTASAQRSSKAFLGAVAEIGHIMQEQSQ